MIKIRHTDLPEGSHVEVRSEGAKTVIHLARALTSEQRRAALGKARQAARVGRSAPLPLVPFALAICVDKVKTTLRAAMAAARVHPIGFAVPAAIIAAAIILYTFVTSVSVHLGHPPQALAPGHGNGSQPRNAVAPTASPSSRGSRPQPQPGISAGAATGARSGPGTGQSGGSSQQGAPAPLASPVSVVANPGSFSSPSAAGTVAPAQTPDFPAPAPTASGGSGGDGGGSGSSGACLDVTLLQVCVHLRAGL